MIRSVSWSFVNSVADAGDFAFCVCGGERVRRRAVEMCLVERRVSWRREFMGFDLGVRVQYSSRCDVFAVGKGGRLGYYWTT